MSEERFNELLRGPVHHPLIPFVVWRLSMALYYVVDACGDQGEIALEAWCAQRERQDSRREGGERWD